MRSQRFHTKKKRGFTLIELMVVISISSLVAFSGFFAFNKYAESQQLEKAVQDIKTAYLQARFNAASSIKDESVAACTPLKGYRVDLNSNKVVVNEMCGNTPYIRMYHTYTMPSGISITNFTTSGWNCNGLEFRVLSSGTANVALPCPSDTSQYITVTNTSSGASRGLRIEGGGIITENTMYTPPPGGPVPITNTPAVPPPYIPPAANTPTPVAPTNTPTPTVTPTLIPTATPIPPPSSPDTDQGCGFTPYYLCMSWWESQGCPYDNVWACMNWLYFSSH